MNLFILKAVESVTINEQVKTKVYKHICGRPDWNLGGSGICLGQIRILIWSRHIQNLPRSNKNSNLAMQILGLPRPNWNLTILIRNTKY